MWLDVSIQIVGDFTDCGALGSELDPVESSSIFSLLMLRIFALKANNDPRSRTSADFKGRFRPSSFTSRAWLDLFSSSSSSLKTINSPLIGDNLMTKLSGKALSERALGDL